MTFSERPEQPGIFHNDVAKKYGQNLHAKRTESNALEHIWLEELVQSSMYRLVGPIEGNFCLAGGAGP